MKKFNWSGLRVLTVAAFAAVGSFVSCSNDESVPPPVVLVNQLEYDGEEPIAIQSAIYDIEDTDLYTIYLSPRAGVTDLAGMTSTKDYIRVTLRNPKGEVDTESDSFEFAYSDILVKNQTMADGDKLQLSVELVKATSQLNLTIEFKPLSGKTLRASYNSTCTEAVPQPLNNEFELDKAITAIGSIVEWHRPKESTTTYYFYTEAGITAPSDETPAAMTVALSDEVDATSIDLSTANTELVKLDCGVFAIASGTTGTLAFTKNADGTALTVSLDGRNSHRLRIAYTGEFVMAYESTNKIKFTEGDTEVEADLSKAFRCKESLYNNFAFGLVEDAEAATNLMNGHYAIQLGLSDLNIGKTLDLATDANNCTFKLYDYEQYVTYDLSEIEGVTGAITTIGTAEKLYLTLSVVFPDGPTVEAEWFGDITAAEEVFDITPVRPFRPHVTITAEDGTVKMDKTLTSMEMRLEKNYKLRGGDPAYGGATFDAYFFHFRPEDVTDGIESYNSIPRFMIAASFIDQTDLNLAVGQANLYWQLRYGANNLLSRGSSGYSETYTMYGSTSGYCPDDVTVTVVKNADKTWKITLTLKDYGSFNSWNPSLKEGTKNTMVIEWEGVATKYTGTSKNDLTDTDY